jgi:hypothetical protein
MTTMFFRNLLERALKTFAQALAATLVAGATSLLDVGWMQALSVAGFAALLSVLSSIGSAPWGDPKTPSLVKESTE